MTNKLNSFSLFSSFQLESVRFKNRIAVSPMCQYYSVNGFASKWHLVHLGSRAVGGAAMVMLEASAVEPRGRISPDDLGIYLDEHVEPLKEITTFIESFDSIPAIQIAHAGRKASTNNPWKTGTRHEKQVLSEEEGGWQQVAPSPIAFYEGTRIPKELSINEIQEIIEKFSQSAKRALKAGFKLLEIHAAHGYLLHSFYSPLSNKRTDRYGGTFENRIRFLLETVDAVRAEWPAELPLAVRISASDWVENGWQIEDSVALSKILKSKKVNIIDCSSAFVRNGDKYPFAPGWQVPLAEKIKLEAQIATIAVGMITEPEQANEIIKNEQADMVMLAREMIRDPYWPFHAAKKLQIDAKTLPKNYTYAI